MKAKLVLVYLILSLVNPHAALAAKLKLCSNATGTIVARSKCKSNEKLVTLPSVISTVSENAKKIVGPVGEKGPVGETGPAGAAGIVGIKGPMGIPGSTGRKGLTNIVPGPRGVLDFSACHKVVSGPASSSAQVTLTANCDSQNEFLYDEEWSITGDRAFLQSLSKLSSNGINGESMPYAVSITTSLSAGGLYALTVTAICCPR